MGIKFDISNKDNTEALSYLLTELIARLEIAAADGKKVDLITIKGENSPEVILVKRKEVNAMKKSTNSQYYLHIDFEEKSFEQKIHEKLGAI